jgi:hypothetical protein
MAFKALGHNLRINTGPWLAGVARRLQGPVMRGGKLQI